MIPRKVLYIIIAVVVAMSILGIEMCKKTCPPEVNIKHSLDSLQYVHEVNVCRLEQILLTRDTITKVITKVKVLEKKVSDIKPIYNSDSLTAKILEIINTDQKYLEL